jgi:hypothetical protein
MSRKVQDETRSELFLGKKREKDDLEASIVRIYYK